MTKQKYTDWNYLFNTAYALLYFSGGLTALYGFKKLRTKGSVGRELLSISISMIGYSIGLLIWSYYNIILKIEIPYPSLADIFFILYIPFLGYGIINLLSSLEILLTKRIFLEAAIIFIISAIIIYTTVNPPDVSSTLSLPAKAFNIFYLLGDSFLITLGILLIRLTQGKIHKSFLFFVAALFFMAFADFLFAYETANNSYWNGDISDLLYAFSGFLFSIGVVNILSVLSRISNPISSK